jgi:hypothetical protein
MDRGNRLDWFESTEIWIELLIAIGAFWVFLIHTFSAKKPFLDPTLLIDRNFALGLIVAFVMGALSFTAIALFPGLLHDLRGYPDSSIGLLLAARGLGNWASFLIIVPMTRLYPRTTLALGLACQALAGWGMANLDINLTDFDVAWTNALQGFGFGLAFTPMYRSELFDPYRAHLAIQQGARLSGCCGSLEPRQPGRAPRTRQRVAATGRHDRLYQCVLSVRDHRGTLSASGIPHARCAARPDGLIMRFTGRRSE